MKVEKECIFCKNIFNAESKEIKRGNANYCSISCSIKHRNLLKPYKKCKCIVCNNIFDSKSTTTKYCSSQCKSKHYRDLIKTNENGTRKLQKILLLLPCANCQWNISSRDIHHIIPSCEGGKNEMNNLITLCPNCHRMAHRKLLSKNKLQELVYFRTISSSSISA